MNITDGLMPLPITRVSSSNRIERDFWRYCPGPEWAFRLRDGQSQNHRILLTQLTPCVNTFLAGQAEKWQERSRTFTRSAEEFFQETHDACLTPVPGTNRLSNDLSPSVDQKGYREKTDAEPFHDTGS
jgi:hypothetical protein